MTSELEDWIAQTKDRKLYRRVCDNCGLEYNDMDPRPPDYRPHVCSLYGLVHVQHGEEFFSMRREVRVAGPGKSMDDMLQVVYEFGQNYCRPVMDAEYQRGQAMLKNPFWFMIAQASAGNHEAKRDERIRTGQRENSITVVPTSPFGWNVVHADDSRCDGAPPVLAIAFELMPTRSYCQNGTELRQPPIKFGENVADRIDTIRIAECSTMLLTEYIARRLIVMWPEPENKHGD